MFVHILSFHLLTEHLWPLHMVPFSNGCQTWLTLKKKKKKWLSNLIYLQVGKCWNFSSSQWEHCIKLIRLLFELLLFPGMMSWPLSQSPCLWLTWGDLQVSSYFFALLLLIYYYFYFFNTLHLQSVDWRTVVLDNQLVAMCLFFCLIMSFFVLLRIYFSLHEASRNLMLVKLMCTF